MRERVVAGTLLPALAAGVAVLASAGRGDDRYAPRSTLPAGSWEAGLNGAQPGVVMPADPEPGGPYRQEYLPGEAEDMARVLAVDGALRVPFGFCAQEVVTRDWSPLDPGVAEHKHYAPGIGLLREEAVEGDSYRVDLIAMSKRS